MYCREKRTWSITFYLTNFAISRNFKKNLHDDLLLQMVFTDKFYRVLFSQKSKKLKNLQKLILQKINFVNILNLLEIHIDFTRRFPKPLLIY